MRLQPDRPVFSPAAKPQAGGQGLGSADQLLLHLPSISPHDLSTVRRSVFGEGGEEVLPPLASRNALRTRSAARAIRALRGRRRDDALSASALRVRREVRREASHLSRWKRLGELRAGEKSLRIIVGPATPRVHSGRCSSPSVLTKPLVARGPARILR